MIIAMPVLDDNGKESRISAHFGHNPLFAICDTSKDEVKIVNIGEHGEGCTPVEGLKKYNPDAVFTIGIGGNAMDLLKRAGMPIKTGRFATVGEVMDNIDSLDELEEGCGH
jgi:predicted Fe-Mo cluster-binding NifX family protein